ncbi:lipocalin family protein [Bernardetia sp. MNP-M8]|uniref:lipocalin family protein n=1 Tax=Bernardetia sp. MNP-M8 TaxID=3127470 RepID=UPI0030D02BEF
MLKLNWLFLLIISAVFLTSCGDEEEESEDNLGVVGTWNLVSLKYNSVTTITYDAGPVLNNATVAEAVDTDLRLTFNANNTYTTEGDYSIKIAPDIEDGEDLAVIIDYQNFFGTGTWKKEGNELIFNESELSGRQVGSNTIIELTANRMVIDIEFTQRQQQQGGTAVAKVSGRYILEK